MRWTIEEVLDELGVGPLPTVPARCAALMQRVQELTDAAQQRETELADLKRQRDACRTQLENLIRQLPIPPPVPPTSDYLALLDRIKEQRTKCADLDTKIAQKELAVAAARSALAQAGGELRDCLLQAKDPLCAALAALLKTLISLLRLYQREITGRLEEPPRPKDVIMRDIRRCQFAIGWVNRLRRLLGCPGVRELPHLARSVRIALERAAVPGPHH